MRPPKTAVVATVALLLTAFAPSAAIAQPVSTYTIDWSTSIPNGSVSLDLVVGTDGSGEAHFQSTRFEAVSCGGVADLGSTIVTAHDAVVADTFSVDRKLTSFHWTGDVEVTVTVTACGETVVSSEVWAFGVEGSSTDRVTRSRINGTRLLSNTLDPLTVTADGASYQGPGILTEAIGKA